MVLNEALMAVLPVALVILGMVVFGAILGNVVGVTTASLIGMLLIATALKT